MTRNDTAFRACRTLLAQGGLVGVFPEGISHDEARLQPLRTGAARIALGAAFDDGVTGVETVAVGLVYDDKARFRSHALVRIGEPEGIEDCRAAYEEDPIVAVRSLTDRLARQLGQVAPMYDSRRHELAFRRVASIVADGAARQDDVARALGVVASEGPAAAARVAALTDAGDAYEADLALVGLSDGDVAAGLTAGSYRRRLGRSVVEAAATAPLAALGAGIHAVPYGIMKRIGEPARQRGDAGHREAARVHGAVHRRVHRGRRRRGPPARPGRRRRRVPRRPVSGYVTVRWAERVHRLGGVARARAVMADRGELVAGLEQQRADLIEATAALVSVPAPSAPLTSRRTRSASSGVSIERP